MGRELCGRSAGIESGLFVPDRCIWRGYFCLGEYVFPLGELSQGELHAQEAIVTLRF